MALVKAVARSDEDSRRAAGSPGLCTSLLLPFRGLASADGPYLFLSVQTRRVTSKARLRIAKGRALAYAKVTRCRCLANLSHVAQRLCPRRRTRLGVAITSGACT